MTTKQLNQLKKQHNKQEWILNYLPYIMLPILFIEGWLLLALFS